MKRLVFTTAQAADLAKVADAVNQSHLRGWRCRAFGLNQVAVDHSGLQSLPLGQRSALLLQAWRGALWGGAAGLLGATLLMQFGEHSAELEKIAIYSLLITGVFFGAWLGGLVGLMRRHPLLERFYDRVRRGDFLVYIDVPDADERLARKLMAMCGVESLAIFRRGWLQFRRADAVLENTGAPS